MLTRLLRRLQGRPAPATGIATTDRPAADDDLAGADGGACADAVVLPSPILTSAFVRHLLGTAPGAAAPAGLADEMADRLDALSQRLDVARLPRLPALVPQLLAALRRDDSDANALAALLARDPTLAGEVVRVANSAHYHRGATIGGLQQAVGVIGNDGLRYVVLTSVMRPILHADPSHQGAEAGARLAAHAEARTWLGGNISVPVADPGEVQLSSVIASTGLAALLRMMPRSLLAQAAADDAFTPRLLDLAGALSARAAAHWRLDERLQYAVRALSRDDAGTPLAAALAAADRLAMLHVLGEAGLVDPDTHVATDPGEQARDRRLLGRLRALGAEALAA